MPVDVSAGSSFTGAGSSPLWVVSVASGANTSKTGLKVVDWLPA
jgi:hypothetical protein